MNKKTLGRRAALVVALLAASAAVAGCGRKPAGTVVAKPPEVFVTPAILREAIDSEEFTGRTEAYRAVELRPQVTGELKKVYFEDGRNVLKGAPLFAIERELYEADVEKARADIKRAEADAVNWKAQSKRDEAELERVRKQFANGAAAQADVDKAEATVEVDKAQLGVTEATRRASEAMLARAVKNLDHCTITAQYTGRMSKRMLDEGNIVEANKTMLATLVVLDPVYVGFDIDERSVLRLRRLIDEGKIPSARESKLIVQVGLADQEGYPYEAVWTFSDNQFDQGTGTLRVRATMSNPNLHRDPVARPLTALIGAPAAQDLDRLSLKLLSPGMFVRVRLPVGRPHPSVVIPEEALGSDQGQRFVFVVVKATDKDKETGEERPVERVVERRVEVGPQVNVVVRRKADPKLKSPGTPDVVEEVEHWRVVEGKALEAGDRVIVSGLQRVRDGTVVRPKPADFTVVPPAAPTAVAGK
jgi:multidrug efflux system membrane fusion protein